MVLVGEMFLAASIQVLLELLLSPVFLNFVCRRKSLLKRPRLDELSTIKMLLEDANEKQHTERDVKTWLDDLKDLAYDVEDILDEPAIKALERKYLIGESQASTSKVRNSIHALLTGLTPSSFKMRERITKLTARFDELMTRKDKLNLSRNSDSRSPNMIEEIIIESSNSAVTDIDQIRGRDKERDFIQQLLLRKTHIDAALTEVNVIPILGMAGIGKTTLAKCVYNNQDVQKSFDRKAWVCVSTCGGDFDVVTITKAILRSMSPMTVWPDINYDSMDLSQLQLKLKELLNGKRFLIVLDDVRNEIYSKWKTLCTPLDVGASGSSIIITTRHDQEVCMSRMSKIEVSEPCMLGLLPDKDCMSILAKLALDTSDFSAHRHLKNMAEEIVRKCEGLPLAVEIAGSLLSRVNNKDWKIVSNSKMWEILKNKKEIVPALMLSCHLLPSHLKRCFAYCSIFPKGYEFDENQMVLLWMAEGLIQPGQKVEMEDLGKEYFRDLLSRSFFQQSRQDKSRFLMHGLIRKLAKSVAGYTCYRMKLDRVKDREQRSIFEKTRHLSYLGGKYDGSEKFEKFSKFKCLRTFLPLMLPSPGNCYLASNVPHQLITRLRRLRVFSLRGYRITELSDSIGNLKHLRHLDLSETLIGSIPESITTLYNLQTLLLEYCDHLRKLPSKFGNLVNLRHLNIQGAIRLEGMPMQIGKLACLQTLSNLVVGKDSCCSGIKELGSLPHLQGTLCILRLENVTEPKEAKDANLISKSEIAGLSLEWSQDSNDLKDRAGELEVLGNLEPHESLKELTIRGYGGEDFPTWLKCPSFPNLVLLKVENCKNCTSLPAIGQLSFLKVLYIGGMAKVKKVGPRFCGSDVSQTFRSLETLHFHDMKEWEENWSPCKEFPKLRELSLRRCPKISGNIPTKLPSLKKVTIYGCGQLLISVAKFPNACEIDVDGSKGLVHSSTVGFNALEIRSLSKVSMFTSQLLGFDKQWMTRAKDLTISTCEETTHLWSDDSESLPDLPDLEILCIDRCPKLVSLVVGKREEELEQDMPCPPTQIEINNCIALKSLPKSLMYNNNRLKLIRIVKCDSLVHIASGQLPPTLERIEISYCKDLKCLLMDADTSSCSNTTSQLEYLIIQYCPSLESLTRSGRLPVSLKDLDLFECPKLVSIADRLLPDLSIECIKISNCELLESLPTSIHTLSTLLEIDIRNCRNLGFSLDQEWLPANLRVFHISGCEKMLALPKGIHNHTSLQNLTIQRCPNVVYFPEEGFPTSLKSLSISHLKIIDPLFKWGLNKLPSLNNLEIGGCPDTVSFPADHEMKLPESLTSLTISHFSNLRNLSSKGFQNLTSLEELFISECEKFKSFPKDGLSPSLLKLYIYKCENLLSFPKNGLPPSLLELHIYQCPLLEKHCKKDGGEEWRKISHVPCVRFDTSY